MNILSVFDLDGTGSLLTTHNIRAILSHTDGHTWQCVCDGDTMRLLCGGARENKTLEVNGVMVSFTNWIDANG